jgi:hypothetical protein
MARKSAKRKSARSRPRPQAQPAAAPRPAQPAQQVGGDQALVRSVEMSLAPRQPARRDGRIVLESGDPAIPLDRVPHFTRDLLRVAIVGAVMIVLLVIGSRLIDVVVK